MAITKRYGAPRFWEIKTKERKFTVTPRPGPHSKDRCIPLALILREYLGFAENMREVKSILGKGMVKINGKTRKDNKFPIGLMDVIEAGDKYYILLPRSKGLKLFETDKSQKRLVKVKNKTKIKKGKTQLNLNDGSNMLSEEDANTNDVLVLENGKIKEVLKFNKGSEVLVTRGKNSGKMGKIKEIEIVKGSRPNIVVVDFEDYERQLPMSYLFAIKKDYLPKSYLEKV